MDVNRNWPLTNTGEVRRLLAEYGLKPRKSLGQNFLVAAGVLDKILEAAEVEKDEVVIEIGPGVGALTRRLAEKGARVAAVEIDGRLIPLLKEVLGDLGDRVRLINADALKVDYGALLAEMGAGSFKVVANLPYYITSPFVAGFLEAGYRFERMVLMVQKEVADRMTAANGTESYGALSVLVAYHTEADVVWRVSRHCFYPPPAVDSAVVRLVRRPAPAVTVLQPELFFRIVRASFGRRRKMLPNALAGAVPGLDRETWVQIIESAGIDPRVRGETLTPDQFGLIADACVRLGYGAPSVL